jgi:hypothetical protein
VACSRISDITSSRREDDVRVRVARFRGGEAMARW